MKTFLATLKRRSLYESLRIFVLRQIKWINREVHLLKYRSGLVPRMPRHSPLSPLPVTWYYPKTPFLKDKLLRDKLLADFLKSDPVLEESDFERLESWLTRPPKYTTIRVNTLKITVEEALEKLRQVHANTSERRRCLEPLVYVHPQLEDLIVIEPREPTDGWDVKPDGKEVIVDLLCGQSILRGAEVYCGGVSGVALDLVPGDPVAIFSDVFGKCLKGWSKPFNGKKVFVANGRSYVSRSQLFCSTPRTGLAFEIEECLYPSPSLHGKFESTLFPQNLPSATCVHVLDPKPGEVVLDMCAAPGGKTTHIATLMKNKGLVIALDKSRRRIEKLRENLIRWEINDCVKAIAFNSIKCLSRDKTPITYEPPFREETFDKVLVDAPCSCLGQRPQLYRDATLKDLSAHPINQRKLLSNGVHLLKVGGTLVYSTCSLSVSENEQVVDYILNEYPCLQLVPQSPHLGGEGLRGDHGLSDSQLKLLQRFLGFRDSSVNGDTIAFFVAKFMKHFSVEGIH